MDGFETKDYSPNDYVYAVPGMYEDVEMPDKDGSIKDILKDWHPDLNSVYGVSMNIHELLRYCENDVRETRRLFRNIFFSNNMRKRHHIPMRRRTRYE